MVDIASIPRVESIVLTGLDFSMKPERARYEVEQGFIRGFPEVKVKHIIKALAVMVYNQEKMTPFYHTHVCNARNPLAFFLCAVHRQQAPQPKTHTRQNSNSSQMAVSDTNGVAVCNSPSRDGKKKCDLPKLSTDSMLPLGNWDCLYYALVAEIHKLHSDLQERFGFGCENGTQAIHYRGRDGLTQEPITPIDLASLLETAWYTLMDNRLVATLDDAVRMKNLRKQQPDSNEPGSSARPPILYGLVDVNALDSDAIVHLLWEKYRAEVDEAATENFEDESMLSAYRAEQYAKRLEESLDDDDAPLSSARPCKCHRACVCKLKCDASADGCTCNHEHVYRLTDGHDEKGNIIIKFVKDAGTERNPFIGATSNTLAQMLIPASAKPDTTSTSTSRKTSDGSDSDGRGFAVKNRKRTNTNNSDLAYVPDLSTSRRTPKDAYPLDFYGRASGHRYPAIPSQSTASSSRRPSADQGSRSLNEGKVPSRKPVLTPGSGSPITAKPVTYPTIPASQSQSMFTQSFPPPGVGTPRDTEKEGQDNKKASTLIATSDPADDYVGLLAEHPSSTDHAEHVTGTEPFPKLTRSVTTSPPNKPNLKSANTSPGAIPSLSTLNKPTPPLPEPDFIAPKPAVKQRYVSAGGNTPLSERAEIPGPAFTTTTPSPPSRAGQPIDREELAAGLRDPEWIRRHFGEAAVASMFKDRRSSDENEARDSKHGSKSASKRTSGRKSDESDRGTPSDKRDRTSSGAGKREKLKRMFSRKNSSTETEC